MKLNKLPTLTWNFLKLNDAVLDEKITLNGRGKSVIRNIPNGVIVGNGGCDSCGICDPSTLEDIRKLKTGLGDEADSFFEGVCDGSLTIRAKRDIKVEEPLCINYELADGDKNAVKQEIIAEEGSSITVIMDYSSKRSDSGFFAVQTKLKAEKGAKIRLVKIELLGHGFTGMDGIAAQAGEDAEIELIQMELGCGKNYVGVDIELDGKRSSFTGNTGYLCINGQKLDMNYYIGHTGKKSVSSLNVTGALRDGSCKNFRGTIDLKHGAKGAKGDEQESALLLSDNVINKTLPIILCDEDDVEGSHGATIGRLSQDVLFYMQSRGFSEHEAEVLMTRAQLNSVRGMIGDEKSVGAISQYLEEAFE
ncbi:MAG: SufD family Fe-S cluster assembly protein [Lachnospiraceae bacterium]|nr:SufD family Fe-S cluster assembly protein [Lachnospiraceae bacterium]